VERFSQAIQSMCLIFETTSAQWQEVSTALLSSFTFTCKGLGLHLFLYHRDILKWIGGDPERPLINLYRLPDGRSQGTDQGRLEEPNAFSWFPAKLPIMLNEDIG